MIGFNRALICAHLGLLGIHLLLGYHALVVERRVTLHINLHVVELRLIFCKLTFSLFYHHLVRTRIDFDESVAFVDELPLREIDLDDLAIDATAYRDRIKSCDGAEADEIHRKIAFLRRGDNDRNRPEHAKVPGTSLPIGARSPLGAGLTRGVRSAVVPDANGDEAKNNYPEPPAAFGGLCRGRFTRAPFGKLYGIKMAHPFSPVSKSQ